MNGLRKLRLCLATFAMCLASASWAASPGPRLVVWAWERPEDLRFLPPSARIAVLKGFIVLSGSNVSARGRRFPLLADPRRVTTAVVHIQIDPRTPLFWTPSVRERVAAAVMGFVGSPPPSTLQIDFEVRASQRGVLLDLLTDVRARLPPATRLSMTALASWCDTESWLDAAPVDEVVPMLFRMGPTGQGLKLRLTASADFADPRCRSALAISSDAPIVRAPAGRRVYLFDPRPWTPAAFETIRKEVTGWGSGG